MLKRLSLTLVVLAAAAAPAAAKGPDWTARTAVSPIGGMVLGNPAAKTKLVEYLSYTCPHCAHYVGEASTPLKALWVKPGTVSVEVRNAIRDKYDLTAALLARCGPKERFFGNMEALIGNQEAWMKLAIAYEQAPGDKPKEEGPALKEIADKTGLIGFMGKRGYTPAQLNACLADPAAMKQILAMTNEAWNVVKIGGTPGFTVNGKLLDAHDWAGVSPALSAALPAAAK